MNLKEKGWPGGSQLGGGELPPRRHLAMPGDILPCCLEIFLIVTTWNGVGILLASVG